MEQAAVFKSVSTKKSNMLYITHALIGKSSLEKLEERKIGGVESIVNLRDLREGTEQGRNDLVSMSVFICAELKTD